MGLLARFEISFLLSGGNVIDFEDISRCVFGAKSLYGGIRGRRLYRTPSAVTVVFEGLEGLC